MDKKSLLFDTSQVQYYHTAKEKPREIPKVVTSAPVWEATEEPDKLTRLNLRKATHACLWQQAYSCTDIFRQLISQPPKALPTGARPWLSEACMPQCAFCYTITGVYAQPAKKWGTFRVYSNFFGYADYELLIRKIRKSAVKSRLQYFMLLQRLIGI